MGVIVLVVASIVYRTWKSREKETGTDTINDDLTDVKVMKHASYFIDDDNIGKITSQKIPENNKDNVIITYVSDYDGKVRSNQYPVKDILEPLDPRNTNVKILMHRTDYMENSMNYHISKLNDKIAIQDMRILQYQEVFRMILSPEGDITAYIEEIFKRATSIKSTQTKLLAQNMPSRGVGGGGGGMIR